MKTNIGVFFGGRSTEHEISVISASQAMHAINRDKYDVTPIYISKQGRWYTGDALFDVANYRDLPALLESCEEVYMEPVFGDYNLYRRKRKMFGNPVVTQLDVVIPVLHGMNGEDGTFEGILDSIGIPYAGCNTLASANGMDKITMKMILRSCDVPVVDYVWFTDKEWFNKRDEKIAEIETKLGYPVIVKPANLGSSVGIGRANDRQQLIERVGEAEKYSTRIIVEDLVEDLHEINCSVLGDCDEYQPSVLEEPIKSGEILSYEDKYMGGTKGAKGMQASQKRIPAELPEDVTKRIQHLACETFRVLSCHGVARVDVMMDGANGNIYVNEINTIPGSLSFYLWEATGIPFDQLMDRLVQLALKRNRALSLKTVSYDQNIFSLGGGLKGGIKMYRFSFLILSLALALSLFAQSYSAVESTNFSFDQCQGSLSPYTAPSEIIQVPDSLTAVMINHVGRHGARYPASPSHSKKLKQALLRADSAKTITPLGRELLALTNKVMALSDNRWGALDSLGMAEMRGIASRMYRSYPKLMFDCTVHAISSYSPRAMMSMYSFTHQLDRLCNRMEFYTSTGRVNDALMRPFDIDEEYIDWRKTLAESDVYEDYFQATCPVECLERILGRNFEYSSLKEAQEIALMEYYLLAGMQAMGLPNVMSKYLTLEQANALWSCFNLRQYLQRTASTLATIPADIAGVLLADIINTTDEFLEGKNSVAVQLRFGHAETLMPLLSLMHVPGCFYLTNYFDTVAQHWQDFNVVPMAANLQMIVFKVNNSSDYCVRFDLNEQPVQLPGLSLYPSWKQTRNYLMNCLPLEQQF